MSFVLFLIFLMLTLDVLWWVHAHRALRRRGWRVALSVFMGFQTLSLVGMVIGRLMQARIDEYVGSFLLTVIFLWHFIGLPLALISMLTHGFVGLGIWIKRRLQPETATQPHGISRRMFLTGALAVPPAFTAAASGVAVNELDDFRIREFELRIPRLPKSLEGLSIAHVSDTHVGGFTRGSVLNKIVEETNKLNADLVLFTGDLINHAIRDLPAATDMIARMRSKHGMFICEGNHDLIQSRAAFEQFMRDRRMPILINESTTIGIRETPVQILGLRWGGVRTATSNTTDRSERGINASVNQLLAQRDPNAFPILLAHHPHAFDVAAESGIPLTLSGHTHGGQLMAGNLGFGPMMYRYWSGLYEKGESRLLVSNGVGNWFPLRIGAPAEILHVTLRSSM